MVLLARGRSTQDRATSSSSARSRGREVTAGSHVVVLNGRHFSTFGAGDEGVALRVDQEAQNCEVLFSGKSQPVPVALRHLRALAAPTEAAVAASTAGNVGDARLPEPVAVDTSCSPLRDEEDSSYMGCAIEQDQSVGAWSALASLVQHAEEAAEDSPPRRGMIRPQASDMEETVTQLMPEASAVDDVARQDWINYSHGLATNLSRGNDLAQQEILRFLESQGRAPPLDHIAQPASTPFEFKTRRPDNQEVERTKVEITVWRRPDFFQVAYSSRSSPLHEVGSVTTNGKGFASPPSMPQGSCEFMDSAAGFAAGMAALSGASTTTGPIAQSNSGMSNGSSPLGWRPPTIGVNGHLPVGALHGFGVAAPHHIASRGLDGSVERKSDGHMMEPVPVSFGPDGRHAVDPERTHQACPSMCSSLVQGVNYAPPPHGHMPQQHQLQHQQFMQQQRPVTPPLSPGGGGGMEPAANGCHHMPPGSWTNPAQHPQAWPTGPSLTTMPPMGTSATEPAAQMLQPPNVLAGVQYPGAMPDVLSSSGHGIFTPRPTPVAPPLPPGWAGLPLPPGGCGCPSPPHSGPGHILQDPASCAANQAALQTAAWRAARLEALESRLAGVEEEHRAEVTSLRHALEECVRAIGTCARAIDAMGFEEYGPSSSSTAAPAKHGVTNGAQAPGFETFGEWERAAAALHDAADLGLKALSAGSATGVANGCLGLSGSASGSRPPSAAGRRRSSSCAGVRRQSCGGATAPVAVEVMANGGYCDVAAVEAALQQQVRRARSGSPGSSSRALAANGGPRRFLVATPSDGSANQPQPLTLQQQQQQQQQQAQLSRSASRLSTPSAAPRDRPSSRGGTPGAPHPPPHLAYQHQQQAQLQQTFPAPCGPSGCSASVPPATPAAMPFGQPGAHQTFDCCNGGHPMAAHNGPPAMHMPGAPPGAPGWGHCSVGAPPGPPQQQGCGQGFMPSLGHQFGPQHPGHPDAHVWHGGYGGSALAPGGAMPPAGSSLAPPGALPLGPHHGAMPLGAYPGSVPPGAHPAQPGFSQNGFLGLGGPMGLQHADSSSVAAPSGPPGCMGMPPPWGMHPMANQGMPMMHQPPIF